MNDIEYFHWEACAYVVGDEQLGSPVSPHVTISIFLGCAPGFSLQGAYPNSSTARSYGNF